MPSTSRAALWSLGTHLQVAAAAAQEQGGFNVDAQAARTRNACPQHCSVLEDLSSGWEGGCYGLQAFSSETQEECRDNCCRDPDCEVWQFSYTGCWRGKGHYCRDGYGFKKRPDNLRLVAAQRIVHGQIQFVKKLQYQCMGLKRDVFYSNTSLETVKTRCKYKCYSDTSCEAWQVVHGKCYYGAGYVCSDYETAPAVDAGEKIKHTCVGEEFVAQVNSYVISAGAVAALLVLIVLICGRLARGGGKHDRERLDSTASRLNSIDEEDGFDEPSPSSSQTSPAPRAASGSTVPTSHVQSNGVVYSIRSPKIVIPGHTHPAISPASSFRSSTSSQVSVVVPVSARAME